MGPEGHSKELEVRAVARVQLVFASFEDPSLWLATGAQRQFITSRSGHSSWGGFGRLAATEVAATVAALGLVCRGGTPRLWGCLLLILALRVEGLRLDRKAGLLS